MLKNHKLAKSISDVSWSSLCNMIDYKSKWYGRTYIKVGKFFPSSKTCHCCGYKYNPKDYNDVSWTENIREWVCNNCGTYLDRDENAAINILNEGLNILNKSGQGLPIEPVDTVSISLLEQEDSGF